MAKIPLRAYFREIEGLIEHGQLDESMAHCKHILQFYPKIIAAYRLLGKTFLEDQRYSDAADVFQRVLSSIPDDFVSQVGMSIIREDEGNLDAAIWHMERAFEVQPYNSAIQDELRRLFSRRDGVEPHKIRLTRGALARMYAKGDLYQQAIAELRAALAEDAQRPDLQILLARMYYLSGMLVEAVDICSILMKKIPYCLEANRLLATILPQTERRDEAKVYQQRVNSLDPYIASAPISTTSSEGVPENVASVEKLDYKAATMGAAPGSQPSWAASLGVSLEGFTSPEEPLPDWLTAGGQDTQHPASGKPEESPGTASLGPSGIPFKMQHTDKKDELFPETPEQTAGPSIETPIPQKPTTSQLPWQAPSELEGGMPDWLSSQPKGPGERPGSKTPAVSGSLIPRWMKEAGWEPGGVEEEPSSETAIPEERKSQAGIPQGEIPDWLRAMAPSDLTQGQPEEEEGLSWLQDISETPASGPSAELPGWLAGMKEEAEPSQETASQETASFGLPPYQAPPYEEQPSEASPTEALSPSEPSAAPAMETGPTTQGLPEWLKSLDDETPVEAAPEQPVSQEWQAEPSAMEEQAPLAGEIPDWLQSIEEEAETGVEKTSGETQPTRLSQAGPTLPVEAEQAEAASQPEPAKAEEAGLGFDLSDQDAALAWLEGLAARQGAAEEELITRPEDRTKELSSWRLETEAPPEGTPEPETRLQEADMRAEAPLEAEHLEAEPGEWQPEEAISAEPATDVPDWLTSAMREAPPEVPEEQEPAELVKADIPDWLKALKEQPAEEEPGFEELGILPGEEPVAAEAEIPDWLKTLGPLAAEGITAEAAGEEEIEAAASQAPGGATEVELPEWLRTLEERPEVEPEAIEPLVSSPEAGAPMLEEVTPEAAQPLAAEPEPAKAEEAGLGFDLSDQDAALAWLEGLAARQGAAEEELITRPEDRTKELSSWMLETEALPVVEVPEEAEIPPVAEGQAPPTEETMPLLAEPVEAVELPQTQELVSPEMAQPEMAPSAEEAAPPPVSEPEIPSWIAEIAAGKSEEEEYTWMPPEIAAEAVLAQTEAALVETPLPEEAPAKPPPAAIPPIPPEEQPTVRISRPAKEPAQEEALQQININTASLVELENLPGVGFVQAQKILAYRDIHGSFTQVDDLLKVPEFNPAVLEEISDRITTGLEVKAPAPAFQEIELEAVDPDQAVLIQARNALIQENVPDTVSRYTYLIKKEHMLDTVIRDLYEALYHFPVDVSIWQTLGDAYVRNNQLQEALDAYIKAEELLR